MRSSRRYLRAIVTVWRGSALAVLEYILQRPTIDAATGVDLIERVVKALLPLRAVLRILPSQGSGDTDISRLLRRRLGVGPNVPTRRSTVATNMGINKRKQA